MLSQESYARFLLKHTDVYVMLFCLWYSMNHVDNMTRLQLIDACPALDSCSFVVTSRLFDLGPISSYPNFCPSGSANGWSRAYIAEGWRQKQRQRSSRLSGADFVKFLAALAVEFIL